MIDTDTLQLELDAVATAEAISDSVRANWKLMTESQKLKINTDYVAQLNKAENGYIDACVRLVAALKLEINRIDGEE